MLRPSPLQAQDADASHQASLRGLVSELDLMAHARSDTLSLSTHASSAMQRAYVAMFSGKGAEVIKAAQEGLAPQQSEPQRAQAVRGEASHACSPRTRSAMSGSSARRWP